ncbi:MAG: hypothetical protein JKY04_07670, partial [Sneathiella sp.]|nr:hypothetical protein [Sneathiella sp.]
MTDLNFISTLNFEPLVSPTTLSVIGAVAFILLAYAYRQNTKAIFYRLLLLVSIFFILLGPAIISENRSYLNDIVLLIVDETNSQLIGNRARQIQETKNSLVKELSQFKDIDVQITSVTSGSSIVSRKPDGTHLIEARSAALEALPKERIAATIMITDGQIHDANDLNFKTMAD